MELLGSDSLIGTSAAFSGTLGLGTTTLDAAAKLQIDSTSQGFLLPRMTTAQMAAIASPPVGLVILNTDIGTTCEYNGVAWIYQKSLVSGGNQTSTSTTYTAITQLTTPSLLIGDYSFIFQGVYRSTDVACGIGIRLGAGTATLNQTSIIWFINQSADGAIADFRYNQIAGSTNVTSESVLIANTSYSVIGIGFFRISTEGTVAAQIRTETAGVSVSIRNGSSMTIKRLGA